MNKLASVGLRRVFQLHDSERLHALQGLPLATFPQRVGGYLIDIFLALMLWGPLEYSWRRFLLRQSQIEMKWDFHEVGNIIVMLVYWASFNYFWNGRTPGKFLAGTRAMSLNSDAFASGSRLNEPSVTELQFLREASASPNSSGTRIECAPRTALQKPLSSMSEGKRTAT